MWLTLFQDRARAASTTYSVFGKSFLVWKYVADAGDGSSGVGDPQKYIDPYVIKILSINRNLIDPSPN